MHSPDPLNLNSSCSSCQSLATRCPFLGLLGQAAYDCYSCVGSLLCFAGRIVYIRRLKDKDNQTSFDAVWIGNEVGPANFIVALQLICCWQPHMSEAQSSAACSVL